jgi:glycosyltransferase involved in cell wall biosynthesis
MAADITVLFASRNRAAILRETLDAMSRVRRGALQVEIVVVDNGSADATEQVLRDYAGRLPLRALWDPVAGKNHALNVALDRCELGRIVVFTDDDVTPEPSWLEDIVAVCERWPRHGVFGGRIDPTWPRGVVVPAWAQHNYIQVFAFARHRLAETEGEYPRDRDPFGPNFWVRREALGDTRYRLGIGPHPTRRKLGGETMLLKDLRQKGHTPVYTPHVRVEHRIEPERVGKRAILRRAVQYGRGQVYTRGIPEPALFERSPATWRAKQAINVVQHALMLPLRSMVLDETTRVERFVRGVVVLAKHWEALTME